jgi:tetratricopeptide (TPR) repeat protein
LDLAISYIELKKLEKAENLLEDVRKFALESNHKRFMLDVDFSRAILLGAEKKWDESIDQFERILKERETLGARRWDIYWFGRLLYEYARVYLERGQEGDREKAHNLLNRALDMFQKIGAKKDIERIIAKKKLLTA